MNLLRHNKSNLQVFQGGLTNNVHVDIRWVVAKMSMFVHVRGVGGQKWAKSCPRGYWTAPSLDEESKPMTIVKNKILEAILELPAKQPY